ncbi:MAG: LuxR C-terminal-related transcriptional regulator [Anaerolineae bacterium]|nr:LuxR C-terminal-related transcriptional regulator [Anaerolineae bacterium]
MAKAKKPFVEAGVLHVPTGKAIDLQTGQWHTWLTCNSRFTFNGDAGHFGARKEGRGGGDYWYAYRRRDGKLRKSYLGKSAELNLDVLEEAAVALAGKDSGISFSLPPQTAERSSTEPLAAAPASFAAQAKIRPTTPPPKLVTRTRLTKQLNTPITLISAPGGYGKSTLLAAWQQTCAMPVAWAALDADDDHLLRFWSTVVMALQVVFPTLDETLLPVLQRQMVVDSAEITAHITSALSTSGRVALVLDNFHHIQQPNILASLQEWLTRLPDGLQLIIAGRTRPLLALGRLRAQGLLTELEQDDLRFTSAEGIDFLQQHLTEQTVTDSELERLAQRTGGWAAGLKLAALALNKHPDPHQFSDSFSGAHLYVRDYFLETALQQQPEAVQTFLLQTSILQQLTGALCDAVTGRNDGEHMLAQLWQANIFLSRAEDRSWYHYHNLFAEMLCNQLQQQWPQQMADLHQRAAKWYRGQNASADAVHHLLAAGAWEEAAAIIEEVALHQLVEYGEDSRLLHWLRQLPETVFRRHKALLSTYLRLARMALPAAEIERVLSRLESELTTLPHAQLTQEERDVLAELRAIRHNHATSQPDENREHTRWQLIDDLKIIKPYYLLRTIDEEEQLGVLYNLARRQGNLFVVLLAGGDYANRVYLRGQLRASEQIAHQVLQHALTQRGKLPEPSSVALYVLSKISLERNELHQARQLLQQAIDVDPNPTSSNMRITLAIADARLQAAAGDHEAAQATLQAARTLQSQHPSPAWRDADLAAYEALFCLPTEEWERVERLLDEAGDAGHSLAQRVRAEMWLRRGQPDSAESLLSILLESGIPFEPQLEVRVLLASTLYARHKLNQAQQVLSEALRQALPERFIRPFIDHAPRLLPLFALLQHTDTLPAKAQPLIAALLQAAGQPVGRLADLLPRPTLDSMAVASSITERELEVLCLVRDGCANQEIGRRLVIAPGTVKTHLANIYRKLDVHNRTQAVAVAHSLRLF